MTARSVQDQICQFFGGPFDPPTHSYRTPQVAGLSVVRRAFPKRHDEAEFFIGVPVGSGTGCVMVVWLLDGDEHRIAVAGPTDGRKTTVHAVQLHCYVRSRTAYAEDAQDFTYDLLDALRARIHADRTCGSGGFENGGFQIGEGGAPKFSWHMEQANTSEEVTDIYLRIDCEALEIIAA